LQDALFFTLMDALGTPGQFDVAGDSGSMQKISLKHWWLIVRVSCGKTVTLATLLLLPGFLTCHGF